MRLVKTAETERTVSVSVATLTTSPERVIGMVAVNWLPKAAEAVPWYQALKLDSAAIVTFEEPMFSPEVAVNVRSIVSFR